MINKSRRRLYPLVTAEVALFTLQDGRLKVLLVRRTETPLGWALPGGVLNPTKDATLEATALREIAKKTRVQLPYVEQVGTWSGPDRDPREWSVSTLYYALLPSDQVQAVAGEKTGQIAWCNPRRPGRHLVFDHAVLLRSALVALRQKVALKALPLHLLPAEFTITQLQRACEAILDRPIDKAQFRRRLKGSPHLIPVKGKFQLGRQRPAQLYHTAKEFSFET